MPKQKPSRLKKLKLPKNRTERIRLGLFILAFALIGVYLIFVSFALTPSSTSDCHDLMNDFHVEKGLGKACHIKSGQAKGLVKLLLDDGSTVLTHGGDAVDKLPHKSTTAASTTGVTVSPPLVKPVCADTNSFQIIYALPAGNADRYSSIVSSVRDSFSYANGVIHTEATKFNASLNLKVRCDSSGNPLVTDVHLSTSSSDFSTVTSDLRSKGYSSSTNKYAVWYDGPSSQGWAGMSTFQGDDRAIGSNYNNSGGTYSLMYGFTGSYSGVYWMHEMGHSMGAVQYSAPHSSGAAHCNDGQDVMCYADGGSTSNFNGNICASSVDGNFDCDNDDYFNPNPPAGSYLATHWNVASSLNNYISSTGGSVNTSNSSTAKRIDYFVQGANQHLYHRWFQDNVGWSGYEDQGECIEGTPTATSWGYNRIDVFATICGTHQLLHRWWNGSTWQREQLFSSCIVGGPAASSWGVNRVDIFARGCNTNNMYHAWFDGSWHSWENLGGTLASAPAAVSWGPGRIDIVVRSTDNAVWHKYFAGSWSGWESLGGVIKYDPAIASWGSSRLDVFVTGTDNRLYHKWWPNSPGWVGGAGWESFGGNLTSGPGATSWGTNRLDVFAQGSDRQVWHIDFSGNWSGWEGLGGGLYANTGVGAASWNRY